MSSSRSGLQRGLDIANSHQVDGLRHDMVNLYSGLVVATGSGLSIRRPEGFDPELSPCCLCAPNFTKSILVYFP